MRSPGHAAPDSPILAASENRESRADTSDDRANTGPDHRVGGGGLDGEGHCVLVWRALPRTAHSLRRDDMHQLTAAHKTLAFGSVVKVKRRDTGADVKVRINDRGPFIEGRIIDLSFAAAKKIDLDVDGVAPVKIKVVGRETTPQRKPARVEEPSDCFWVQVGAFGDSDNARRAEAELERSGEAAVVLEGLDEFWRVRVGPFDEKQQAERARNRITDAWPTARIIPCGG